MKNPNHKCGQTNYHLSIERKQSVSTSKSFNYCSAATSSPEIVSVPGGSRGRSSFAAIRSFGAVWSSNCASAWPHIFSCWAISSATLAEISLPPAPITCCPDTSSRGSPCPGQWWCFHTRQRLAVVLGTTNGRQQHGKAFTAAQPLKLTNPHKLLCCPSQSRQ